MTNQQSIVLRHLQTYGTDTDTNIARVTGIPRASVRRTIQELQDLGVHVSYSGQDGYALADTGAYSTQPA